MTYKFSLCSFLLLCCLVVCGAQTNEWHLLTKITPKQANSAAYKFLVNKFGAAHLLTECDPEEAALLGDDWLIKVMDDGDGGRDGETIGHGATLQGALDSAAAQYISPSELRSLLAKEKRDHDELRQREAKHRKKCRAKD